MKSKTRNSKGSKKSPNGVAHGSKDSNTDRSTNLPHVSPRDQDHLGSHPPPSVMPTTTENRETPFFLADSQAPLQNSSVAVRHTGHGPHASSSGALDGAASSVERDRSDRRVAPTTSMETEYIGALYSNLSRRGGLEELPPNSSSESDDIDYEDMDSYEDQGDEGDCEDFDDALGAYEHNDPLSSQEAIFMELRREHVEFEENLRQLRQQLQRQGSLFPLSSEEGADLDKHGCNLCSDPKSSLCLEKYGWVWRPVILEAIATAAAAIASFSARQHRGSEDNNAGRSLLQHAFRYSEFLPRSKRPFARPRSNLHQPSTSPPQASKAVNDGTPFFYSITDTATTGDNPTVQTLPIRHMYRGTTPPPPAALYPLPLVSPYRFGRKSSEFLEPVGEFHEFQSAEGNSRQVLLHVWPPSSPDAPLLQELEVCCRDFQENDIVRGHSGDGFLNGWRPSWKQPQQTGVLRFGHWRVKTPVGQGARLFPPFQTPLTLAAGGGSVLGSNLGANGQPSSNHLPTTFPSSKNGTQPTPPQHQHHHYHHHHHRNAHQGTLGQEQSCQVHGSSSKELRATQDAALGGELDTCTCSPACRHGPADQHGEQYHGPQDLDLESSSQGRLLRLIRAIQKVEKEIIAKHLKYLFPTLYEKYHGLQFGTPRLFDAVATVALAMDVSPRLHHDRAHTKHGFCWIIACGDFVGGDLCIPELGKRVVMRPGTVVAIRSTVVAYYVERYARNTSMYTMYAYTSDNNWPPAA